MEDSQISTSSNLEIRRSTSLNYVEKAWYLGSILLRLRRPVTAAELAGRCTVFKASPEFVELLCGVPDSPICLTARRFVVLSMAAVSAFGEFVEVLTPKVEFRVFGGERMLRSVGDGFVWKYFRKRKKVVDEIVPVSKRRAVLKCVDESEREITSFNGVQSIANDCFEGVELQIGADSLLNTQSSGKFHKPNTSFFNAIDLNVTPTIVNSNIQLLECPLMVDEDQEGENKQNQSVNECVEADEHHELCYMSRKCLDLPDLNEIVPTNPLFKTLAGISAMLEDSQDGINLVSKMDNDVPACSEQHKINLSVNSASTTYAAKDFGHNQVQETKMEDLTEQPLMDIGDPTGVENILVGSWGEIFSSLDKLQRAKSEIPIGGAHALKKELAITKSKSQPLISADPQSHAQVAITKSSALKVAPQAELTPKQQTPSKVMKHNKLDIIDKDGRGKKHRIAVAMMDKPKHIAKKSPVQERCDNGIESSKDQQKPKFPIFDSYTVEEEEGSGGYGIVYRARRKTDGLTFAIKCPHRNAQNHHVKNELKMLERFGGENFVITYEGSLKNEGSDCFILEHVEHDRPEVLKREIDIPQLQWYGYCMFSALVSLHKQGVFHRDIKPGNFLFSRKSHKGFLIDFNLAKDMYQKQVNIDKSKPINVKAIQHIPAGNSKSVSPNKRKKLLGAPESKTLKKKPVDKLKTYEDIGRCNSLTSQGADGSGITSTKTLSAERFREPLPCKGRKALINLAQEAMQSPNHGAAKPPASNRKRVSASPGIDKKLIYPTPTPLHSSGMSITGAGSLMNRGESKVNKDGACVGTKGFRAPEVLLRSLYQGPKIDVWSVGVTLLYLISGRMPFNGDPEQNLKEIVKLKGNEELWEVAMLHSRESSFPVELLDIRFSPSMTIEDWLSLYTKRSNLLESIPISLFDLLEKCLTVNPRLRITADEALSHEFFAPCHEAIRKKSLSNLKRGKNQDSRSKSLPFLYEPVRQEVLL